MMKHPIRCFVTYILVVRLFREGSSFLVDDRRTWVLTYYLHHTLMTLFMHVHRFGPRGHGGPPALFV